MSEIPNEMIIRVAKAICTAGGDSCVWDTGACGCDHRARKAIEALREPTKNMCNAAGDTADCGESYDIKIGWQAMIDECLK